MRYVIHTMTPICALQKGYEFFQKAKILRAGFEPATYGYLIMNLQSTALPTELSKVYNIGGWFKFWTEYNESWEEILEQNSHLNWGQ